MHNKISAFLRKLSFLKTVFLLVWFFLFKVYCQEFPLGPVVRTLRFHCRGHRFDPWSGK